MNDFLTFTKGERVAIIVLAAVIFLLIAANFFIIKYKPNVNENSLNIDSIMALHEAAIEEYYNRQRTTDNGQQFFLIFCYELRAVSYELFLKIKEYDF